MTESSKPNAWEEIIETLTGLAGSAAKPGGSAKASSSSSANLEVQVAIKTLGSIYRGLLEEGFNEQQAFSLVLEMTSK